MDLWSENKQIQIQILHPQGSDHRRGEGMGKKCGKKSLKCSMFVSRQRYLK